MSCVEGGIKMDTENDEERPIHEYYKPEKADTTFLETESPESSIPDEYKDKGQKLDKIKKSKLKKRKIIRASYIFMLIVILIMCISSLFKKDLYEDYMVKYVQIEEDNSFETKEFDGKKYIIIEDKYAVTVDENDTIYVNHTYNNVWSISKSKFFSITKLVSINSYSGKTESLDKDYLDIVKRILLKIDIDLTEYGY